MTSIDTVGALPAAKSGALVSLVDAHRQWFKSKVGLDAPETPRDISFCGHAIHGQDVFEVPDAFEDERFRDNPLVTAAPNVRFYAGAPLITPDGHNIGTLCVIDHEARHLTPDQRQALAWLGRQVVTQLELRATNRRLAELQPATRMNTLISAMLDASGKATSAAASKPSVNAEQIAVNTFNATGAMLEGRYLNGNVIRKNRGHCAGHVQSHSVTLETT